LGDDIFTIRGNKDKNVLIRETEKEVETLTKWLTDSGLKVKETKMELGIFYRKD
jgi:hypothetical protein